MKKNLIISITVILVLTVVIFFTYNTLQQNAPHQPTVSTIEYNGKTYQATGALPVQDINGNKAISELISLGSRGVVSTPQFRINPKGGSNFVIELLPPYASNKTAFINWLKTNDYSHINPDQLTYSNVAK